MSKDNPRCRGTPVPAISKSEANCCRAVAHTRKRSTTDERSTAVGSAAGLGTGSWPRESSRMMALSGPSKGGSSSSPVGST
jgi:hypothetical protein